LNRYYSAATIRTGSSELVSLNNHCTAAAAGDTLFFGGILLLPIQRLLLLISERFYGELIVSEELSGKVCRR
jgi:hypothetical protein